MPVDSAPRLDDRAAAASRPSVLVAEDEALAASALEDCLLDLGFDVTLVSNGVDALAAANDTKFDVLLTDLRMPGLDGGGLIRQLRATRPMLPVVVMTGQASPDWRSELTREGEGPTVLLTKPVSLRAIVQALHDAASGDAASGDAATGKAAAG
jgi:CheY-like chemotaxis protein